MHTEVCVCVYECVVHTHAMHLCMCVHVRVFVHLHFAPTGVEYVCITLPTKWRTVNVQKGKQIHSRWVRGMGMNRENNSELLGHLLSRRLRR